MKLSEAQRLFLKKLEPSTVPIPRSALLGKRRLVERSEERARRECKRKGLAEFVGGRIDGKDFPMGWCITEAGREALSQSEDSR